MTSRLKRKLNDLGVDPSSSKASENFCLIGTPLPPLEKSKDTGEFVPLWKQDVRDEKGRRRLHGAFTGGFSAGYFNTVGSKEGWAPSTFVSSRAERAKKQKARPEDFMDEEDLAELRESRQLVDENEEMDFGGTQAELQKRAGVDVEDDSMANALAASLAPPVQDSIGARILKKMGWRMGQGIGPRVTYEQRRAQDRAYGFARPDEDAEDEEAKKHMYPRRDTPLLTVPRKDNSHGLGYSPGMDLNESLGRGSGKEASGPRISAGFGLGALNDADDDDLDVYDGALGSMGSKRILAYDAEDADDHIAIGSSRRGGPSSSAKPIVTQTFRDGRPVLKGFVLADQPIAEERWFPLPEVPPGWKPNPRRVWEADANKGNRSASIKGKEHEVPKSHEEWKRSLLSADERGNLLGETPLPAQPRSVFDFMSQKDKERLDRIRNNLTSRSPSTAADDTPSMSPPPPPVRGELDIPHIHPSVAKAALSGFQPFRADPVKQSRYMAFLTYASQGASSDAQLEVGPLPDQTIDDFNKELADYAKSATVFKPLSGAMASRFKSAAIVELGPQVVEGLHTPVHTSEPQEEEKKEEKDEDPRMGAARAGMYGPLTREVSPWQPAKLLCKRFGVKDPEVDMSGVEPPPPKFSASGSTSQDSTGASNTLPLAITDGSAAGDVATVATSLGRSGPRNLANVGLGEDDEQGKNTLTYQRPAMDVFKAIFASDDEESDSEDQPDPAPPVQNGATPPVKELTPGHLSVADPPSLSYQPKSIGPPTANEKIDIASFKPTFVPRDARKDKDRDKDKDKKRKRKAKTALVSFDDEDEGLHINVKKHKDKDGERKKKRRKEEKGREKPPEDDDSMWVEKPAPEIVQSMPMDVDDPVAAPPPDSTLEDQAGPPRGRKRAIDFM